MAIVAGNDILASDFVSISSGATDSGKVPKLDATGKLLSQFLVGGFGGDGSDGALSISSGTTTISLGGAAVVVKNYTSISITGTGNLAFSNPHANGTIIILRSTGNVVITSSSSQGIDLRLMGAAGGAVDTDGTGEPTGLILNTNTVEGKGAVVGVPGAGGAKYEPSIYTQTATDLYRRAIFLAAGCGGGGGDSGDGTASAGGRGSAALLIECAGDLNFTGTINGAGETAADAVGDAGAGGGGSVGNVVILYNTATATSGTINTPGGDGGGAPASGWTGSGHDHAGGGGAGSPSGNGGSGGTIDNNGSAGGIGAGGGGAGVQSGTPAQPGGNGGTSMGGVVTKNDWIA